MKAVKSPSLFHRKEFLILLCAKNEGIIVWVNAYYGKLFRLFRSVLVFFLPIREKMKFNPKTIWNKTIVAVIVVEVISWMIREIYIFRKTRCWWIKGHDYYYFLFEKFRRASGGYSASCSFASASSRCLCVCVCVTSHHLQGKKNLDSQYKSVFFNLTKVFAVVSKKATFFLRVFSFLRETATTGTTFFRFNFFFQCTACEDQNVTRLKAYFKGGKH